MKMIVVLMSICIILLNFNVESYAITKEEMEMDSTINGGSGKESDDPTVNPNAYSITSPDSSEKLEKKAGVILGVVNVAGIIISVITIMLIGMKYMFGSIEEKAEYKKTATIYLVGAILVMGGTTIPNILYKIGTNLFK
ncbi:unknown [Clostridium sp. CAG:356]|nr:unknown [Clostridium sp. CAG:356]